MTLDFGDGAHFGGGECHWADLYCLAVQAGFYICDRVFALHAGEFGLIPVREEIIFLHLLYMVMSGRCFHFMGRLPKIRML